MHSTKLGVMRFGPEGYCDTFGFQMVLGRAEREGPDPSVRFFEEVPVRALQPLADAISEFEVPVTDRPGLVAGVALAVRLGADLISGFRVLPFRVDERVEVTEMSGPGPVPAQVDELDPAPTEVVEAAGRWALRWPDPGVRADLV